MLSVFAVAVKSATDLAHHNTAFLICGFTVSYLSLSVEQGAWRRYRIGVYFRVDPSELEGVELRSQRLTNREDSPLRCAAYRNARSKNYGSARIQASRPLLDA